MHQVVHTYKDNKMADPKKEKMTPTQEAYAEGIRTGKKAPVIRNMAKGLSKAVSTPKEKRMIDKGYSDIRKAVEAEAKRKRVKKAAGGMLKAAPNKGVTKLPKDVRNKMGFMKKGGAVHTMPDGSKMKGAKHGMKAGGYVLSAEDKERKKIFESSPPARRKAAKKMKHGGAVKGKKCRMDGIAVRGKTRAKQRSK